jgi:peptidoglycan/LPS O-acetylase OafA/YrhL
VCLVLFTFAIRTTLTDWEAMRAWGGVSWFFAYLGNLRMAWTGTFPPIFSFDPLWSLQVEEQFYLVYPLIVLFLSRRRLRQVLIICVLAAPLLRLFLIIFVTRGGIASYVLMPCRMDSLALGGLVALFTRSPVVHLVTLAKIRIAALASGTLVLACTLISPQLLSPIWTSVGYTLIDGTCALLLMLVVLWPSSIPIKILRWSPLVYTGKIAYGLYLLHAPSSWAARLLIGRLTGFAVKGHSALSVPITLVSAFIAASLSWRFFESPILSLKDRFAGWEAPSAVSRAEEN